jgi:hypothetical protein
MTDTDSTRTYSEEEDKDDNYTGDIENLNIPARSDEEASHSIRLSFQKKMQHLKKWRCWNYINKWVLLCVVIMLGFLALSLHARSQSRVA